MIINEKKAFFHRAAGFLLLVFLFVSCGMEVPEEKLDYVGYWHGENMLLEIQRDGDVSYFRKEGEAVTTIDSPIQNFEGDDFTIGYLFFTETFDVDKAPYQDVDGQWKMIVNGVLLTKQEVDLPEYH